MNYIYQLLDIMNGNTIGMILELLLITSCISTIIYLLTKNQYISLLSSAPIFFISSLLQYRTSHLFFLLLAILTQAIILLIIQNKNNKRKVQG
ncbi:hypothetical protein AAV98_00850 [Bacillus sp. CHD6a]|nr:hypothetical protein AAV98_00850 [Bacillus sp. CHD6a]